METFVIGLCGGSGSGKTTLANQLLEALGDNATVLQMDSFYKYQSNPSYEERCKTNYDHPDAFDADLLRDSIAMFKNGNDIEVPVYDYTIHNRSSEPWTHVKHTPVLLVDGILLFAFPEIMELLDLKIFVDTPADERILRRVKRDTEKRGRTVESVMEQYLTTVKPMHDLYIEPKKIYADIIVPSSMRHEAAYKLLVDAIRYKLEHQED